MKGVVGCPHCLRFVSISERTIGLICKCGRYFGESTPWHKEEEFEGLVKKGAYLAANNATSVTPEHRVFRQHMEGRAEQYAEKVKSGGIPYNDPNE